MEPRTLLLALLAVPPKSPSAVGGRTLSKAGLSSAASSRVAVEICCRSCSCERPRPRAHAQAVHGWRGRWRPSCWARRISELPPSIGACSERGGTPRPF